MYIFLDKHIHGHNLKVNKYLKNLSLFCIINIATHLLTGVNKSSGKIKIYDKEYWTKAEIQLVHNRAPHPIVDLNMAIHEQRNTAYQRSVSLEGTSET